MAGTLWPADAVTGAPSYTGRALRQTLGALMAKGSTRLLGARTGIHPATSAAAIVTATSTTWTMLPHTGTLDLEAGATAGPYSYSFTANETGAVTAAHATLDRIDLLSILLSDPAEGDGTAAPAVTVVYTAGTAGSGVPPGTPARSLALAQIAVPHTGAGSPTVTIVAPYTAAAGGIIPVSATTYPATPHVGQYVDDPTLGLCRWTGTAWQEVDRKHLGGYVQTNVAQALSSGVVTALNNNGTAAWTVTDNSGGYTSAVGGTTTPIIIPAGVAGVHAISFVYLNSAMATTRGFVSIYLSGVESGRFPFTGDDRVAGTLVTYLAAGQTVGLRVLTAPGASAAVGSQLIVYRLAN